MGQAILDVPSQFATIQAAIDAADPFDTVRVAPGVYHEKITLAPDVTLVSTGGALVTTIDGFGQGSTVVMASGVLEGFTITNGSGQIETVSGVTISSGGGIVASTQVRRSVIRD